MAEVILSHSKVACWDAGFARRAGLAGTEDGSRIPGLMGDEAKHGLCVGPSLASEASTP